MDKRENKKTETGQIWKLLSGWLRRAAQLCRQCFEGIKARLAKIGTSPPPEPDKRRGLNKKMLTIGVLCAAGIILTATAILVNLYPVYQIHSSAMSPTLAAGDTVVCKRGNDYEVGDIVAVKHKDLILIKRIAAKGGDRIMINESGELFINELPADEPYATTAESSKIYITQVPQGKWYLLNDNRIMQGDSRLNEIGSVSDEEIIGRVILTVWPTDRFGTIDAPNEVQTN